MSNLDLGARALQRREQRTVVIDGLQYPPRPMTIGLDRELRPLRETIRYGLQDMSEQADIAAGVNRQGIPLPESELATKAKRREAEKKMQELFDEVTQARCDLIAASLLPSEDGSAPTSDDILQRVELPDIEAAVTVLTGGQAETLEDPSTGDTDGD